MIGSARSRSTDAVSAAPMLLLACILAGSTLLAGCAGFSDGSTERPPPNFRQPLPAGALPGPDPADRRAIRAVLARQEDAWNRGDLEAFMAGYARTDTLRFASGGNVRTGWEETLANYRAGYPDRAAMGTLSFSDLDVDLLSGRHALVFGRWRLEHTGEAGPAGGLFTLLFQEVSTREGRAWRIVSDHTSSD